MATVIYSVLVKFAFECFKFVKKKKQKTIVFQDTSSILKEEQVLTAFEDDGSYIIQEQQDSLVCQGILDLEAPAGPSPLDPESLDTRESPAVLE